MNDVVNCHCTVLEGFFTFFSGGIGACDGIDEVKDQEHKMFAPMSISAPALMVMF